MKKGFVQTLLLVLLIIISIAFAYYYGTQQKGKSDGFITSQEAENQKEVEKTPSLISSPTPVPTSNIPYGWKTYTNEIYRFEISYPSSYKALTDEENLYGWPNGIVLIYAGGQSYDLVIEHWSTQSEYENKYRNQSNITIKKIGDVYISMLNANFESEVDEIIETFKIINPSE
ncbi:MAG: hypothetical protein ABIJ05_01495 [Patescibacteria group bacterium]